MSNNFDYSISYKHATMLGDRNSTFHLRNRANYHTNSNTYTECSIQIGTQMFDLDSSDPIEIKWISSINQVQQSFASLEQFAEKLKKTVRDVVTQSHAVNTLPHLTKEKAKPPKRPIVAEQATQPTWGAEPIRLTETEFRTEWNRGRIERNRVPFIDRIRSFVYTLFRLSNPTR